VLSPVVGAMVGLVTAKKTETAHETVHDELLISALTKTRK
jgi:hypothetical protein